MRIPRAFRIISIAVISAIVAVQLSFQSHILPSSPWIVADEPSKSSINDTFNYSGYPVFRELPPNRTAKTGQYHHNWLLVSKKLDLAFTFVPKVMCTSIRTYLTAIECSNTGKQRCAEARRNRALRSTDLTNYTRAIMLRDPFERAYSAYKNSNINPFINLAHCRNKTQCTFDQWVDELYAGRHRFLQSNEHFRQQTAIAQFDRMHYNYILRMTSPVDQRFFWHTLMKADTVRHTNAEPGDARRSTVDVFRTFRRSTMDKLADMYADDVEYRGRLLEEGTPRVSAQHERTVYDYYIETRKGNSSNR